MSRINELNEVFCSVFQDDTIDLRRDMTANDVDGWDSLSHLNLILAVETRFKFRFTQKELLSLRTVGDLVDCIEKKAT